MLDTGSQFVLFLLQRWIPYLQQRNLAQRTSHPGVRARPISDSTDVLTSLQYRTTCEECAEPQFDPDSSETFVYVDPQSRCRASLMSKSTQGDEADVSCLISLCSRGRTRSEILSSSVELAFLDGCEMGGYVAYDTVGYVAPQSGASLQLPHQAFIAITDDYRLAADQSVRIKLESGH